FKGVGIRTQGSGNIGGTNVWRVYGRWLGFPVVFLDTAKGFVPALLAVHFAGHGTAVLAGAAAMLGHYRPLFLGFARGGKMVATARGAFLGLAPIVRGIVGGRCSVVLATLPYAPVASMLPSASLPITAWVVGSPLP